MPQALFTMEERRAQHAEELFVVLQDPLLYEFIDEEPPESVQALAKKLAFSEGRLSPDGKEHWLNWIVRTEGGEMAGYVQATVEESKETNIAYVFSARHQGKGLARGAVENMLALVTAEYSPGAFYITAEAGNTRSLHLAQKLGFTLAPDDIAARRSDGPNDVVFWKAAGLIE